MAAIGRNQPCPCGSGEKFKRCCALKGESAKLGNRILLGIVAVVLLGGALVFLTSLDELGETSGPTRMWSAEHGHWH